MSSSRSSPPSSPRRDPVAEAVELQSIFDLSTVDFSTLLPTSATSPRATDERMRKRTGSSSSSLQGGKVNLPLTSLLGAPKELRKLVGTRSLTETKPMVGNLLLVLLLLVLLFLLLLLHFLVFLSSSLRFLFLHSISSSQSVFGCAGSK
jgi:hypothetical protein